jgi:hypothetical protein
VPGPRRTSSCAIGRGRTGAAAAGTHRAADAEPADPAAGGDGRHAAAAAQGVQLTEAGSVLEESRAVLLRIDHGISRPARRRAWGGRSCGSSCRRPCRRTSPSTSRRGCGVRPRPQGSRWPGSRRRRTGSSRRSANTGPTPAIGGALSVGRVHRYGPRPSRRISPDRRGISPSPRTLALAGREPGRLRNPSLAEHRRRKEETSQDQERLSALSARGVTDVSSPAHTPTPDRRAGPGRPR